MRMAPTAPTSPRATRRVPRRPACRSCSNEGYSVTAPDLSSLVTKLKRARPDVILHTGYNPDISLFLRQARELGLRFDALIGHGAGYTDYTKIKQSVGTDANYFFDVDPISIWETNPKALQAGAAAADQDGRRRLHEGEARHGHQVAASRHGGVQHLRVPVPTCCRARSRSTAASPPMICARRRSTPMCRMAARCWASASSSKARTRPMAGQNDRAYPGGDPVHRRQELRGVAEVAAAARAGAEAAGQFALRREVIASPCWKSPD